MEEGCLLSLKVMVAIRINGTRHFQEWKVSEADAIDKAGPEKLGSRKTTSIWTAHGPMAPWPPSKSCLACLKLGLHWLITIFPLINSGLFGVVSLLEAAKPYSGIAGKNREPLIS